MAWKDDGRNWKGSLTQDSPSHSSLMSWWVILASLYSMAEFLVVHYVLYFSIETSYFLCFLKSSDTKSHLIVVFPIYK